VLSQNVQKLGYVDGVGVSSSADPMYNLSKLPWWSDGYRAVLLFVKDQITLGDLDYFGWEDAGVIYDGSGKGTETGAPDRGAQGE